MTRPAHSAWQDERNIVSLYDSWRDQLYSRAVSSLHDDELCREIVHNAFVRLDLARFNDDASASQALIDAVDAVVANAPVGIAGVAHRPSRGDRRDEADRENELDRILFRRAELAAAGVFAAPMSPHSGPGPSRRIQATAAGVVAVGVGLLWFAVVAATDEEDSLSSAADGGVMNAPERDDDTPFVLNIETAADADRSDEQVSERPAPTSSMPQSPDQPARTEPGSGTSDLVLEQPDLSAVEDGVDNDHTPVGATPVDSAPVDAVSSVDDPTDDSADTVNDTNIGDREEVQPEEGPSSGCTGPGTAPSPATAVILDLDLDLDDRPDVVHLYASSDGPRIVVEFAGGDVAIGSSALPPKPVGDLTANANAVALDAGDGDRLLVIVDDLDDGETFWTTVVGFDGCTPVPIDLAVDGVPFNGVSYLDRDRPVGLLCADDRPTAPLLIAPVDGEPVAFEYTMDPPALVAIGPGDPAEECWR